MITKVTEQLKRLNWMKGFKAKCYLFEGLDVVNGVSLPIPL